MMDVRFLNLDQHDTLLLPNQFVCMIPCFFFAAGDEDKPDMRKFNRGANSRRSYTYVYSIVAIINM